MTGKTEKRKKHFAGGLQVLLLAGLLAAASGCGKSAGPSGDSDRKDSTEGFMNGEAEESRGENPADAQGDSRNHGGEDQSGSDGKYKTAEWIAANQEETAAAVTDFGLRLLQQCIADGEAAIPESGQETAAGQQGTGNLAVSPLSVLSALNMTANGAGGETLKQMEETFGISVPELSAYLSAWREASGDKKCRLDMANGIWFTEDDSFTVEQDFLDNCADSFGAEARRVPFDDSALREINDWVNENTRGMIPEIVDKIPEDAVMYLVNALAFEGEWEEIYREDQVREGEFTQADGTIRNVEMMYSQEEQYLEDEHASGFLKYYAGRKYAYAALLPEEGTDAAEYLLSLDGEKLRRILTGPVPAHVMAGIPRYESRYGAELGGMLQEMGMEDAFDSSRADFSGIGHSLKGNLCISRVLHKSFIAVDEKGTRAGAATAVEMEAGGALSADEVRFVYLDRPFVYMIIDCETKVPVFMGIQTQADREGYGN